LKHIIGIRREDKNRWEARVPITPSDASDLMAKHPLEIVVQTSPIRVFKDQEYREVKVRVAESLDDCPVIIAVKEIPTKLLQEGRTYIYFSHTIKGQPYNMAMLRRLIELKCQLIDYETISDDQNRRLVFFGRHAGLAGMIDTLWTLGERLKHEGLEPNPFAKVQQAYHYRDLADARATLAEVGRAIEKEGLPESLTPLFFGFAGYGNVSQGAQEILDLLPFTEVPPEELAAFHDKRAFSKRQVYKTVFHEKHIVTPVDDGVTFELQDYYGHPEKYRSVFNAYLPYLSVLVNCIYWTEKYPRLVTKQEIADHYAGNDPRLKVLGDISCDVEGSVEFLLKTTYTDNPIYVYDPATGKAIDGVAGRGPVVLAVDNLPCELPRDSSKHFSQSLKPFVQAIAAADYSVSFEELDLPAPIKKATILHHGELTPDYRYIEKFLTPES